MGRAREGAQARTPPAANISCVAGAPRSKMFPANAPWITVLRNRAGRGGTGRGGLLSHPQSDGGRVSVRVWQAGEACAKPRKMGRAAARLSLSFSSEIPSSSASSPGSSWSAAAFSAALTAAKQSPKPSSRRRRSRRAQR